MNNLQIFKNKTFGEIRVIELNGEFWFVGKDIAEQLGYKDTSDALKRHVDDEDKGVGEIPTPGGNQNMKVINESGLYSLILSSKLPSAKLFKRWVTNEILPSIRSTGTYNMIDLQTKLPTTYKEALQHLIEQVEVNEQLQLESKMKDQVIKELKPKADYTDMILKNKGLVTITQIAKDYGMSGKEMNKILHERGIQYKQSGQWLLYKQHQGKGYTHSETIDITRSNGMPDVKMTTKWTQKGRLFLYDLLKTNNILPDIEKGYSYQTSILG
ncbi:anti-repressor [Clostridioides difficile]|uniref:Bro-N domain-containing protein n=4 Tax=Clostridioides difficile TaxID=1496 RepID=A0A9R0BK09_CLODR|nr:phage antirepressor [Clostridioides difficile]OFU02055.1 phage antirepressor protein [Clostridium sp. HMSC19E03]OFU12463.1 phage antirepressor protein [Clostridium sp. HMSC19C09]OFU17852.1 phage antirepressor protein [Clostridium sp. HMSC19C05]OFU22659.1 phage antirepressor protein [Clostridium sp. HMSC19C08]OFU28416.1 phage antirepressor protein [Clostridium sp. HMSC19B10]OFU38605.1 phage antirepressor protein [Clostridium sp. HMSC19B01]